MKPLLTSLLIALPVGLALAQEPERAKPAKPVRMAGAKPVAMAAAGALDAVDIAKKYGFYASLLRYHSGDALPDFDLLRPDGTTLKFAASRAGAPTVVVMAPSVGARMSSLFEGAKAVQDRYGRYGVKVQFWGLWQSRQEFLADAGKVGGKWSFALFGDPVGSFQGEATDQEARLAHHRKTVLGRLFQGGMTSPLPSCYVVGADGKLAGSFAMRGGKVPFDGIGNLLLRAGVELGDADRPSKVAPASAFARPKQRAPESRVQLVANGTKAADFAMVGVDGKPVRLSDYAGKVVVLDFWATWCGPCKAALPHVQELARHYKEQGVVVLASCTNDGKKAFDRWIAANGAKYPDIVFAFDPLERSPERGSRKHYGVSGIPQQFVIGRDGLIKSLVTGYMRGEVLLDAALAEAGIDVPEDVLARARQDLAKRAEMDAKRRGKSAGQAKPVKMKPVKMKPVKMKPIK